MANQEGLTRSPAWKKPSDIMKVHLKKRRSSSIENFQSLAARTAARSRLSSSEDDVSSRPGKRRNPFGHEGGPPARRRASQEDRGAKRRDGYRGQDSDSRREEERVAGSTGEEGIAEGVSLFQALDSGDDQPVFPGSTDEEEVQRKEYQQALRISCSDNVGKDEGEPAITEEEVEADGHQSSKFLPLDWSIKSRVRFSSPHPFNWSTPLKTTEEAKGLCSFVRCEDLAREQGKNTESVSVSQSCWKARLQQSLMMWSHPHLPWLKLFPRITLRSKSTSTSFAAFDEAIQKELLASWSESFHSVFYLLRSGYCPYFYLLAHQYTVLFRAAGVGGVKHIHALFTPTSKGLREALKEEGIEFSLPLAKLEDQTTKPRSELEDGYREQGKQTSDIEGGDTEAANTHEPDQGGVPAGKEQEEGGEGDEEEEEELVISQDDAGASSWLQSMGLDKQSFPSLEPSKVNFQRDQLMKVDNQPQSTVLIQGSDTQALYNFLLNTRTTVATTGAAAGIPPTLLAPIAFQGATLMSYKWKANVMKQAVGNKLQESHSLEVTGPLLPHNIFHLCKLLEESQRGNFCGSFNNHEPTLALSQVVTENNETGAEDEGERNMQRNASAQENLSDFLAAESGVGCTGILKELSCVNGLYQW